jgi:hypothetical protein
MVTTVTFEALQYKGDFSLNFYDNVQWKVDNYLAINDQHCILEWCIYMLRKFWPEMAFLY